MTLEDALARIAQLEGDKTALRQQLETEGFKAREKARELQAQLEAAKARITELEAKQPPEGAVVLNKADSERWAAYQALGKVDEVRAALEAKAAAEQRLAERERADTIRAAGYEPKKLGRLIGDAALKLDGDALKLIQGEREVLLSEWAEAEGITDLLNVARLETPDKPRPPTGAGTKPAQGFRAVSADERQKQLARDPSYQL